MGGIDNSKNDAPELESEKPEGLDDSEELDMLNYPLDSLLIRSQNLSVQDICRRIKKGQYVMDPDFQRDFIWPPEKQSRLIESLLMRIPLPVFYLAEHHEGKIIVIDGLQRLTTISHFLDDKFSLRALDDANEAAFKGKFFKDLSVKLQNRIEDTQLILYILDEKVPERAKLDIFERVNGGTPLSRQQMRNCIYNGKATKLLAELSNTEEFAKATGDSLNWRTMRDREFINRFMAFSVLGIEKYKGDMDQFLADALKEISTYNFEEIDELGKEFITSMKINYEIFGEFSFRKHIKGHTRRNVINASLFDVFSYYFADSDFNKFCKAEVKAEVLDRFYKLPEDESFQASITYSTNGTSQVQKRFAHIKHMLEGII